MYRIYGADLKKLTSLGIGGRIETLMVAERPEEAEPADTVVGRGTNVLASDAGLKTALMPAVRGIKLTGDGLYAGSGEPIASVAAFAAGLGLTGLEWASGIPGSVGGAVKGNAGAFGVSTGESIVYCQVNDGRLKRLEPSQCGFGERSSAIAGVVTGACFRVKTGDREGIYATVGKYSAFRRATQPRGMTAGSTFKAADRPAGWYLDRAGLKGAKVGGASVSELHANFIINDGTASSDDAVSLIRLMKARVYDAFGVELEEEIVYIGEF